MSDPPPMTVGDLKKALANRSDDSPVYSVYEGFGYGPITQLFEQNSKWVADNTNISEDATVLVLYS